MFDKRLMAMCPESKKYIVGNIICQWTELMVNALMIFIIANAVGKLYRNEMTANEMIISLLIFAGVLVVRFFMTTDEEVVKAYVIENKKEKRRLERENGN